MALYIDANHREFVQKYFEKRMLIPKGASILFHLYCIINFLQWALLLAQQQLT